MWLAGIFGPFMAIIGLWMLLYHDNVVKITNSIKSTPGAFYMGGVFNLLVGLTILSEYDSWMHGVACLVTLLGWVMIIRGILALFIPQLVIKLTMTNRTFLKVMGVIPLVWGLALCWFAFWS